MPVLKLTQSFINTASCTAGSKRTEYCDSDTPGLYYLMSVSTEPGHGTYYSRWKDPTGKTCHTKLGKASVLDLGQAKAAIKQLQASIQMGANPQAKAKAEKEQLTFGVVFEQHYLPVAKKMLRSWRRQEELYRLRIKKVFGHKRINQITRGEIVSFFTSLLDEGLAPASCNHHAKLIRRVLSWCVENGISQTNVASRIHMLPEMNAREIYLDSIQLEKLMTVIDSDENRTICHVVKWLLSTGARCGEALRATHSQIDKANRVWRIPASNSKSKRVRSVPLNDSALDVLAQLDTEGKFDYLFINKQTGKPYTTVMKVWARLRAKAGLPHLRLHDLRHSYASFLVNSGRTLYEVQQILGHSDSKVTARYSHLSSTTLQAAANSASVMIKAASQGPAEDAAA